MIQLIINQRHFGTQSKSIQLVDHISNCSVLTKIISKFSSQLGYSKCDGLIVCVCVGGRGLVGDGAGGRDGEVKSNPQIPCYPSERKYSKQDLVIEG